jgi:hypothetical protein
MGLFSGIVQNIDKVFTPKSNIVVNTGTQQTEIVNGKKKKRKDNILNLGGSMGVAGGSINKKNAYGIGV